MLVMLNWVASLLTIKTVLVAIITGLIVKWIMRRLRYKLPPGPSPLPIVGNMLQFKSEMMHEQMFEWSKTFGPVISVYLGPSLAVVVNDLKSAKEVTVQKGSYFGGRLLTPTRNIIVDYGHSWKMKKKLAMKALSQFLLGNALEERVHSAIDSLSKTLSNVSSPLNPNQSINMMMGEILIGVCFGGAHTLSDSKMRRLIEIDDEVFHRMFDKSSMFIDRIPGLQYVWETSNMKWLKETMKELKDMLIQHIKEHEETTDSNHARDFIDSLIIARREARTDAQAEGENTLTDKEIFYILLNIIFAGIQTSRHTLQYAILHMVAYQDVQSKVQEEIDRVVGPNDLPNLKHIPELGYTEAVLRESVRLSSVLPTGLPHKTLCDTTVGGYDVPRDTMVLVNHWALHHDPSVWKDVDKFTPERFLDGNGKLGPKPENWFPFSAGKRVCLGEAIAKQELLLLFAALMHRFKWNIPEGSKVDLSADGNVTFLYPKPHTLSVERRNWNAV